MPLYLTASHSSRVQKPASLRRSSSSPFSAAQRTKRVPRAKSLATEDDTLQSSERLEATGKILSVAPDRNVSDVMSALECASSSVFCPIPDRAGMNSTRIAEVLNFQRNLPPVVSLAHVHALVSAASKVEREISSLLVSGSLRKIRIVGRGNDVSGLSEVLISTLALETRLRATALRQDVVENFLDVLRQNPRVTSFPSRLLPASDIVDLMQEGFLVSSSLSGAANTSLSGSSLVAMPSISRAASGSIAAVGGDAAFEQLGGFGGRRSSSNPNTTSHGPKNEVHLSIPNLGPYLRLLNSGRSYLLELLGKSKYREAPLYLVRERWDGAVDSDSSVSSAKRSRGEFSAVLPARTKKWKNLHGLNFDWALDECLGAGLVELFETHSVGLGIRALT